ncbi:MAG: lipid A export permease/ATP-binding protein MsbA [Gammaproteobacteria bacterium]|jgi:subfamily B ATP-binding cassette protein MsbA
MFYALQSEVVRIYARLFRYVSPHSRLLVIALVAAIFHAAADAALPLVMEQVGAYLTNPAEAHRLARYIPLLIVGIAVLRAVMDFVTVYFLSWVGRSVVRDLRGQLFERYLRMPARFYDAGSTGELLSRLTYNTEQVAEAISNAVVVLVKDLLTILWLIAVMIYLSWQLSLLVSIVAPIVILLVASLSRAFRRYSSRIQNSMGDVTRVAEQSLSAHKVVKVFRGEQQEAQNFDSFNHRNFRLHTRLAATRAAGESLTQLVIACGVAAIIYVAFSDWLGSTVSAAVFMAFIFALAQLLAPLRRLININSYVQRGIAAATSVFAVLDMDAERDTGNLRCTRARGDVEYRDVSFAYDSDRGKVLHNIDLSIASGETVALVGRSGSGKSSLVGLLPRFYDVDSGVICIDGVDIREYRLCDLRNQIALVSQDVMLFDDSIANNIAYGALRDASREEIERAAEAAHVLEFANEFPEGLAKTIGERGTLLSGGQRQRIAIARALLKNAPILILDEATSALDTESERIIQEALERLIENRTTLIIAHRLSTIENADRIVVLDEGAIVESGAHEQLLQADGFYAALYRMQFSG